MIRISRAVLVALLAVFGLVIPSWAQTSGSVTPSDIQRLQDNIYDAQSDVARLRSRESAHASQLQAQLDHLRDEVIYLKVKLRRENTLSRSEYADVRDRIEDVRSQARGDVGSASAATTSSGSTSAVGPAGTSQNGPSPTRTPAPPSTRTTTSSEASSEVPAGTEMDVRLLNSLNSGIAKVEDRFEATTLVDLALE